MFFFGTLSLFLVVGLWRKGCFSFVCVFGLGRYVLTVYSGRVLRVVESRGCGGFGRVVLDFR